MTIEERVAAALAARADAVEPAPHQLVVLREHIARRRRRARVVVPAVVMLATAASVAGVLLVRNPGPHTRVLPAAPTATGRTPSTAPAAVPTTPPDFPAPPLRVGAVADGPDGVAALSDLGPALLDATTGQVGALRAPDEQASAIGVSADGRYVTAYAGESSQILEVLDRSGRILRSSTPGDVSSAAWAPTGDDLAVVAGDRLTITHYGPTPTELGSTLLPGTPNVYADLAWSPDGQRLAVGAGHSLVIVDATGNQVGRWTSGSSTYPAPAVWSDDGAHLVEFAHTESTSIDADGVGVVDLDVSTGRQRALGEGLAYDDWWHADGGSAVVGTLGGIRDVGAGKTVVRCDLAAARCTTLAGDARTSAFGAVATAGGIAYLRAANSGNDAGGPYPEAYALVLAAADGTDPHAAPGAPAVVAQVVAGADGRTLLLVGGAPDAAPAVYRYDGTTATRLAPVSTDDEIGYYGHCTEIVDWRQPAGGSSG